MRVRVIRQMFQLQFMIEKPRPDLLTLSTTFYDVSVLCNLFSKAEMRQFGASGTDGLISKNFGMMFLCYFMYIFLFLEL